MPTISTRLFQWIARYALFRSMQPSPPISRHAISAACTFGTTPLIGAEVESLRFRRPVLPGTRLRCRATVTGIEAGARPGQGYARLAVETLDADSGEVLLVQRWKMLLPDRS